MLEIHANAVILDIKGVCSARHFYEQNLISYAENSVESYLEKCWDTEATLSACDKIAKEIGHTSSYDWLMPLERKPVMISAVVNEFKRLSQSSCDSAGLKEMQSCIWLAAYQDRLISSEVFDDIPQSLSSWKASSILAVLFSVDSSIYQREFFAHSQAGDLSHYFAGFFDSSIGSKKSADSYRRIAGLLNQDCKDTVLLSCVPVELDAAKEAGLQTIFLDRENTDKSDKDGLEHTKLESLYDLRILKQESLKTE